MTFTKFILSVRYYDIRFHKYKLTGKNPNREKAKNSIDNLNRLRIYSALNNLQELYKYALEN